MEQFYIGQFFDDDYPETAAAFCNSNNCHIEEVTKDPGKRRFQIKENPPRQKTQMVRIFAKDAIWVATKDMVLDEMTGQTAWEAFKTFLLDSHLWEGWSMQAYLLEENPFFAEFYPKAVAVFGKELVDNVLEASVVSTKPIIV